MPELPEVETMRRNCLPAIDGTIVKAARTPCTKRPISISPRIDAFHRRVVDQRITSIDRLGKRVVVRLASDDRIILEPRMTGIVLVGEPPNDKHLRFELILKNVAVERILFWDQRGLGRIALLSGQQYDEKINSGQLGPDACAVTAEVFRQRGRVSRRPIKVALLDQKFIAGVGNLYAAEILHVAGVDPRARCDLLSRLQWERIHEAMVMILNEAIEYEGSTLSDGTYQQAINDPGNYQNHHRVYDRANQTCPTCRKSKIKRIVQAQRSTFFCSRCQKKRAS